MKQVSFEQICELKPCGFSGEDNDENYTPDRIRELMSGREFVVVQDIYDHPDVSWEDKYWLLSKLLSERDQHELACRVALTCEVQDDGLRAKRDALIQTKRDWLDGKISDDELDAYRAAYRAAGRDADRAAYRAAGRDAYWAADRAAYWAADRAAYRAAYWAADRAADRDADLAADRAAAYEQFCGIALEMLEREK